jgi:hypothetical protein
VPRFHHAPPLSSSLLSLRRARRCLAYPVISPS